MRLKVSQDTFTMDWMNISMGSALTFLGGIGATLTLFMFILKQVFEYWKEKRQSAIAPVPPDSSSPSQSPTPAAPDPLIIQVSDNLSEVKKEMGGLASHLKETAEDLRAHINNVNKERKDDIRRLQDRMERLHDKILEWIAK